MRNLDVTEPVEVRPPVFSVSSLALDLDPCSALVTASRLGFSGVELYARDAEASYPPALREEVRHLARRHDLTLSLHAPLDGINLASFNPGLLAESRRQHHAALQLAAELEAEVLVVHPGQYRGQRWEEAWAASRQSLEALIRDAEETAVRIALENVGLQHGSADGLDRTAEDFERFLAFFPQPSVGMCLDVGHAWVNGNTEELLQRAGSRIFHMHIHDNRGYRDDHLAVGAGMVDYSISRHILGDVGILVAEVHQPHEDTARAAKSLVRMQGLCAVAETAPVG